MRKLHPEEYQKEWANSQQLLEQELRIGIEVLSVSITDLQAALGKVKKELSYQSITNIHGITITAAVETVIVEILSTNAKLVSRTCPIYHYHVHYCFFKQLRENAGITFDAMADLLHISSDTYMHWEEENFLPKTWVKKLILEKYRIVTFKHKIKGKILNNSAFQNPICT